MMNEKKVVLLTGAYGMIGFHVLQQLLTLNYEIIAIDYDQYRSTIVDRKNIVDEILQKNNIKMMNLDLSQEINHLITPPKIDLIIHLAAFANISYSIKNSEQVLKNNINSTINIFKLAKKYKSFVIYASSSSVYGSNNQGTQKETDTLNPYSPYAKSKLMNEMIAQYYFNHHKVSSCGLRFFTVYGPWNRPDMFIYNVMHNIQNEKPIILYHKGKIARDFTYVEDIAKTIIKISEKMNKYKFNYEILNLGAGQNNNVEKLVNLISQYMNKKPIIILKDDKPEYDALSTCASIEKRNNILGEIKFTTIEDGLNNTVIWYKKFIH